MEKLTWNGNCCCYETGFQEHMRSYNGISKVGKNDNRVRIWERGSDWFAVLIASILTRGYSLNTQIF